jgi:hypothetical protein
MDQCGNFFMDRSKKWESAGITAGAHNDIRVEFCNQLSRFDVRGKKADRETDILHYSSQ